jgi:hypothetical protein
VALRTAGANFAWCNRQIITHAVREAWRRILGPDEELAVLYDVSHNIAKLEQQPTASPQRSPETRGLIPDPIVADIACCACAASGHATAPPRNVMNSRRLMEAYPQGQSLWTKYSRSRIGSAVCIAAFTQSSARVS